MFAELRFLIGKFYSLLYKEVVDSAFEIEIVYSS